ncbi:hypothetical protein BZL53_03795 [Flavobacterium columnare]|uniref:hypothetical protein n=1 Tax=Flavobacterium columnare TaxID=996 RepID=UPI000981F00F|nr:hypothetical protein [Flavobacterium columnare]OOB84202.1 hypothetical protein BZL53_03795 [Flavobacterium columnare]
MNFLKLQPYKTIENQDFQEITFIISKEEFRDIEFQDGKITFTINACRFKNVKIENSEIIEFYDISLQFIDCYIENFDVNEINTKNISILFNSCIFSGTIQNSNIKSVLINNCIINDNIFLIGQNVIDISYTEENIYPKRWEKLIKKTNTTFLDLIKIKQSYHIYDSKKVNFYTNENKNSKRGIYRKKYQTLEEFKIGYFLKKEEKKLFNIHLSINFNQFENENNETKILNSSLNLLSLSGYSSGKISIENTKITEWFVRDFSTEKETNFYNISPLNNNSKIEIHKSNLDNTWFDNIDFSKYDIVSFFRTKFGKTIFTSCDFPIDNTSFEKFKTLENVHYPEKKADNYYKNQYEIFLQLKIILESTGNFYEAQKLQAISNDALQKINTISNWDKAILWINGKSNNHGLSIKRPFFYFLSFSIFLYILYLKSLDKIFNCNEIDYSLFGHYFSFIDLTHKADFLVDKKEFNFYSLTFDFINKLISGFFIYQFISAFRKYGKNK